MEPLRIQIIVGTTREGRRAESLARWVLAAAAGRDEIAAELVDLAAWNLPFLASPVPPVMGGYREELTAAWAAQVAQADGFVLVAGEYNHGYPAVLKNALDLVFAEWNRKPVGIVSYGAAAGGARCAEQLRQVAVELDMVPLRRQVLVPNVWRALDDEGAPLDRGKAEEVANLFDDLAWWAHALRAARDGAVAV